MEESHQPLDDWRHDSIAMPMTVMNGGAMIVVVLMVLDLLLDAFVLVLVELQFSKNKKHILLEQFGSIRFVALNRQDFRLKRRQN